MKNSIKKIILSSLSFVAIVLTGCHDGGSTTSNPSTSSTQDSYTVTFYNNYEGAADPIFSQIIVQKGGKATKPETDPTREGFTFDAWYKDPIERGSNYLQDFNKEIRSDRNLYAGWTEIFDFTFDYNYSGAPAPTVAKVVDGDTVDEPADPTRSGYAFTGWKVALETPHYYDFRANVMKDMTIYATWGSVGSKKVNATILEAEYNPSILTIHGATYSGGADGKGLIQENYYDEVDVSNGYFVHFLYNEGNTLTFNIVSDEAVNNATIYMRLSGEYATENGFTINTDNYKFELNDVAIDYGNISFSNIPVQGQSWHPFEDYLVSATLSLLEGNNKIEMITDNKAPGITSVCATAPMIDCLKIYSTSVVTWPEEDKSLIVVNAE